MFHGFSTTLSDEEVENLESLSHVIALIPKQVRQLHTTRSPHFLGLNTIDRAGLLKETDFDFDLVIGLIDTGISPESKSFNDRDLGLPPPGWKGQCVSRKGEVVGAARSGGVVDLLLPGAECGGGKWEWRWRWVVSARGG